MKRGQTNIFATNTPEDIMEKYYCKLHSFLDGDENCPDCKSGRVELPVMPNEVLDGGLTEEEQEFMEMIINWQMENPKAYERIKAFADISISRATLFSALADYASQREA